MAENRSTGEHTPLSPTTTAVLTLTQGLLPALTAIVGGLWIVWTYIDNQKHAQLAQVEQARRESDARTFEARKPFLDKQLALYIETSQVTGQLVSADDLLDPEWKNKLRRFEQLYWTELSMVEDDIVKSAMEDFGTKARSINVRKASLNSSELSREMGDLRQSSYRLAKALRSGIESRWNLNFDNALLRSFAVTLKPAPAQENPLHVWTLKSSPDRWEEKIVGGRLMNHPVTGKITLNGCEGTITKKEEDPALQFFIPAIACQGMMMLFRRDQNPWNAWLPMIDINKARDEARGGRVSRGRDAPVKPGQVQAWWFKRRGRWGDYKALLLSFTAAASTYTSLPSFRNFSDICAMPCSLSLSVAA